MDELLKDLEGLLGEGGLAVATNDAGEDVGVAIICQHCAKNNNKSCLGELCSRYTLGHIAARLTELGWVKPVKCGECKYGEPNMIGVDVICNRIWEAQGTLCTFALHHYCSEGERVAKEEAGE